MHACTHIKKKDEEGNIVPQKAHWWFVNKTKNKKTQANKKQLSGGKGLSSPKKNILVLSSKVKIRMELDAHLPNSWQPKDTDRTITKCNFQGFQSTGMGTTQKAVSFVLNQYNLENEDSKIYRENKNT